ncbi:hypothetical protein RvY_03257 [Ramazzottius varieornatus]|uniref:MADF domain-containing protein n=1 Tax=Ramazzottius varieornatus TaxID=947166 RepID=A0A1D1UWU4_RAMVA|nr:hypothetical protein RvY_03257 [Ramazzottius varieornatus]
MSSQQLKPRTTTNRKRAASGTATAAKKTTSAELSKKTRRKAATKEEWSDKDIAEVITLVQKNSVIYDTGHADYYKGKDKRPDIWEDMAAELKLDKTGGKLKEHPASGAGRQAVIESWPHWESMQFVKDYITPNESVSTLERAKAAVRAGEDFSLVDGTTDDEESSTGNGKEVYDGSLADDEIPEIPNPPSVRSSTASTLSSGSKSKRRSNEIQCSRQLDEYESKERKLASQADELTKALGVLGTEADSPEAQYGTYLTATLLSQNEDDRKVLRRKIQQAIAMFLYEQATGFGFPVILA